MHIRTGTNNYRKSIEIFTKRATLSEVENESGETQVPKTRAILHSKAFEPSYLGLIYDHDHVDGSYATAPAPFTVDNFWMNINAR